MSEHDTAVNHDSYTFRSETDRKRADILRITPPDADPIVYWHQVAQDAIRTAEHERERTKHARADKDKAERDYKYLTERLVDRAAQARARTPLDFTNLIEKARTGDIDLNVSIGIYGRKGANNT